MIFREHRRHPASLADLLVWGALVADGVVANKDGSFTAAWRYRGPDLDSATPAEIEALAEQVNRALLPLDASWLLSVDAIRSPAPPYPASEDAFQDAVTALIDLERRQAYERRRQSYETRFVLSLTYLPPPDLEDRAARWLLVGDGRRTTDWRRHLASFERARDDREDLLASQLAIERLDSAALLRHLYLCLTGLDHPVEVPPTPIYLDALLASEDFRAGFRPAIGPRAIAPIGVTGLPLASRPGLLDFLNDLPVTYRWSSRWLPLDLHRAEAQLRRYRTKWSQKRKSFLDFLRQMQTRQPAHSAPAPSFTNRDADRMANDADEAIGEASGGAVRFGYYTPTILLVDGDGERLDDAVRLVLKELRNHGLPAQLETVNAVEAFLGSLPGHGWPNIRRPIVHTRNLVDLMPTTAVWSGHRHCPSPLFPRESPALLSAATGTTPFRLNLHVSDVGHTLVVGPTGSGKSTLLGLLMAQFFRYPNAQVFAFDKGYSAFPLASAAGGRHYDIASPRGEELTFYPLAGIDRPSERAWVAEWLETLLVLQGLSATPAVRLEIDRALRLLAEGSRRTFTDFSVQVQSAEVREALRPYTLDGSLGSLLDSDEDALTRARFQVFEVSHLMDLGEKAIVPVLLYLFHRIEARLTGPPTLLVLDEAWTYLLHSLFADRVRRWLKELRKRNAAVVFATQSLADLRRSEERYVLYESCTTRILLPNPEARSTHVASLYEEIGLNARELEILARGTPKRDYYFVSPDGRRLFDLDLGPLALAFVGAGDPESLRRIRELRAEMGDGWPVGWLRERGLDAWADRFEPQPVLDHFRREASA